ncbi:hypothetical protein ABPG74_001830 [Tetrahymena malaccensis]
MSSMEETSITAGQKLNITAVPLFQLDVNYDSLKKLLDTIDGSIMKCQKQIDSVKVDVGTKSKVDDICNSLKYIAKATDIYDQNFVKILQNSLNKEQFKLGKGRIDQETEPICHKFNMIGNACTYLYQTLVKQDEKINKLEQIINTKADDKGLKEKIKKSKNKLKEKIQDACKELEDRVAQCEKTSANQMGNVDALIKDVERRTIWKIQDCQDLLSKRVNEEFVNEAIGNLEKSIKDQINQLTGGGSDKLDKIQSKLNSKLQEIDDNVNEKTKQLKQAIKDVETGCKTKYVTSEKFLENNKSLIDRISQLQVRLKAMESELDYSEVIDDHKNQFVQYDHRIKQIQAEVDKHLNNQLTNDEMKGYETLLKKLDPHKLCQIEADLRVNEENIIRHEERIAALQSDMKRKLESLDFFSCMQSLPNEQGGGMKPEEIKKLIYDMMPKQLIDEEKYRKIQRDLNEVNYKIENAGEIERRVTRIFKEIDINNVVKQLKQKANSDDVKKDQCNMESRFAQLSEMVSFIRRDLDNLQLLIKKNAMNNSQVTASTQIGIESSSLLTTKKLFPINCLSCGPQAHTQQTITFVKQRGDRMSRADILNRSMVEYNVVPEQTSSSIQQDERVIFNNPNIPTPKKQVNPYGSQQRARPYSATTRKQKTVNN